MVCLWAGGRRMKIRKKRKKKKNRDFDIHSLEEARKLPPLQKGDFSHLKILPEMLNRGAFAGWSVAQSILSLPPSYKGKLILSYDVPMDSRWVWEIPEVVEFTRGMILSHPEVLEWFENQGIVQDASNFIALLCTFPDILVEEEEIKDQSVLFIDKTESSMDDEPFFIDPKAFSAATDWLEKGKGSFEDLPEVERFIRETFPHWIQAFEDYSSRSLCEREKIKPNVH